MDKKQKTSENGGRRKTARVAWFAVVFCVVFFLLQFLLTPDYDAYTETGEPHLDGGRFYTKIMLHDLYTAEENIDMLFLGSSHTYWQYIPSVIDEYLDVHSFNAGTSAQQFDGSYALLVEAGKKNKLDTVVLEVCPSRKGMVFSERTNLSQIYIVSDYMRFSLNKIRFLLKASEPEHYVNSFFPLLRNKQNYLDRGFVKNVIKRKLSKEYRSYSLPEESPESEFSYVDRGYLAHRKSVENEDWQTAARYEPIKDEMFSSEEAGFLEDIAGYCKKHEIHLILISTPLTDFNIAQYGNYDSGREQIARFAAENGLEFYDFNLCRPEYFTCESTKYFDPSHMNHTGAEEYSILVGRFFSGEITEDELFYGSYEEKLQDMGNRVFGLAYTIETNESGKTVHLEPVASAEFPVYVNIESVSADGTETRIIEKELLEDLHFDKDDTGTITVEVLGDDPDGEVTNTIHIEY